MSQKNKKPKVLETKVKDSNFIRFSVIQTKYLEEVRTRTVKEFNDAVDAVCNELGIVEKLKQAPPGMYKLRMNDLSGLDILPPPRKPDPPPPDPPPPDPPPPDPPPPDPPPPDPPKGDKPPGKSGEDK